MKIFKNPKTFLINSTKHKKLYGIPKLKKDKIKILKVPLSVIIDKSFNFFENLQ